MRGTAVALALLIACIVSATADSVVIGGSIVSEGKYKNNNELHIIKGGETLSLKLTSEGPDGPLEYREELLYDNDLFEDFISTLVIAGQEENGFSQRVRTIITKESLSLSTNRRTLTIAFNADPEYQIENTEFIFFQLAPSVLRCKCSYRLRMVNPVVILPMEIPVPSILISHPVICASKFVVELQLQSVNNDPIPDIVISELSTSWSVESTSGESVYVNNEDSRTVSIEGVHKAGNITIGVIISIRDMSRQIYHTIERVSSPMPAEVDSVWLFFAGTFGNLNARHLTIGNWSTNKESEAVIEDKTDPTSIVSNLTHGSTHHFRWEVAGHLQCPVTVANVTVISETAKIISTPDMRICSDQLNLQARQISDRAETRATSKWSVNSSDIVVNTSSDYEAQITNIPYGKHEVVWSVQGDKNTVSTDSFVFERLQSPEAKIIDHGEAFLGQDTFSVSAIDDDDGSRGVWTVTRSTCTPYPDFSPTSFMTRKGVLEHLSALSEPCSIEVQWTLQNPPCSSSVATSTINVVPRPPTKPSVGSDIVLCRDEPVRLSGNEVEVGQGLWHAVNPNTLEILYPQRPRALVPTVDVGKSVLKWEITNGNDSQSAELTITRHELPDSIILKPVNSEITICGSVLETEFETSHFGPGDFGSWSAGTPKNTDPIEASIIEYRNITFVKNTGTFGLDSTGRVVTISNIPPGLVYLQHRTFSRSSMLDCPEGKASNLTIRSIQFPVAKRSPRVVYTTDSQLELNLEDELLRESFAGNVQEVYFGRYLRYLSTLPGEWKIEGATDMQVVDSFSPKPKLQSIPHGESFIRWIPTACDQESLSLLIVRGRRLQCLVSVPQAVLSSQDNSLIVVGSVATVSISGDFPLDTTGLWSTVTAGVDFLSENEPSSEIINLPSELAVAVRYDISAGVSAFAGRCTGKIRSVRAKVRNAVKAICSHTTEINAIQPEEGISRLWRIATEDQSCDSPPQATSSSSLSFENPSRHSTQVFNIPPGESVVEWVLSLRGFSDSARVLIKRDVMKLPFNSETAFSKKTIIGMNFLKLPWEDYQGYPKTASDWKVPEGCSVRYCPETQSIEFYGISHGTVKEFETIIVPPTGSSCESVPFTLQIRSVTAHVLGSSINSECELLSGASITLMTTGGLSWNEVVSSSDVDLLKIAFGPHLGPSINDVVVTSSSSLKISFLPTELLTDSLGRAIPLVINDVAIPVGLFLSDVILNEGSVIQFTDMDDVLHNGFTIMPVSVSLSLSGNSSTTEDIVSGTGGLLTITLNNMYLEGILRTDTAEYDLLATSFLHSLESKGSSNADVGYNWASRRDYILGISDGGCPKLKLLNTSSKHTLAIRTKPDMWYAISDHESVHFHTDLSTVCSITKYFQSPDEVSKPTRIVRSSEIIIRDIPCTVSISGEINECDLEEHGASINVTALGCSFSEHHELSLSFFKSNLPTATGTSWDTVVSKRRLTSVTDTELLPKRRVVIINPAGADVYEIKEGKNENLTLIIPRYALSGTGSNSGWIRGTGVVEMKDTYLEVINGNICATDLRQYGHTIMLRLHGDSWKTDLTNKILSSELVGAISGQQGVVGGWDYALLSDVLSESNYELSVGGYKNSDLQVKLPPMKSYKSITSEVVSIKIPGLSTSCAKCLNHSGIVTVNHDHDVLIQPSNITEKTDRITLSIPCGTFSNEVNNLMLKNSFSSVNKLRNGFGVFKDSIISTDVEWVSNNTVIIPINWPVNGFNSSIPEMLNFSMPATAIRPQPLHPAQLVGGLVIMFSDTGDNNSLLFQWVSCFASLCPVLLFWLYIDFMREKCVVKFVNTQSTHLGIDFRWIVEKLSYCSSAIRLTLWWFGASNHWVLVLFSVLYRLIGILGILLLGSLLGLTNFMHSSVRREMTHLRSYINCCIFLGSGSLLHVILSMDSPYV